MNIYYKIKIKKITLNNRIISNNIMIKILIYNTIKSIMQNCNNNKIKKKNLILSI